jgi:cytochrome c553
VPKIRGRVPDAYPKCAACHDSKGEAYRQENPEMSSIAKSDGFDSLPKSNRGKDRESSGDRQRRAGDVVHVTSP